MGFCATEQHTEQHYSAMQVDFLVQVTSPKLNSRLAGNQNLFSFKNKIVSVCVFVCVSVCGFVCV